eukprot:350231-Chlamydomonas_euryale.AAC.2
MPRQQHSGWLLDFRHRAFITLQMRAVAHHPASSMHLVLPCNIQHHVSSGHRILGVMYDAQQLTLWITPTGLIS